MAAPTYQYVGDERRQWYQRRKWPKDMKFEDDPKATEPEELFKLPRPEYKRQGSIVGNSGLEATQDPLAGV